MVSTLVARANTAIDWIVDGYRPAPQAMGILRVVFALFVLFWPRNIAWVGEMPALAFDPPPGPFALLTGPAPTGVLTALVVIRAVVALWVLIGWNTRVASAALTVVLIICSGLTFSFGKVNHSILFDLAPLMFGLAGWGSAWSVDALRRKHIPVSGYVMFVFGIVIAFSFLNAAVVKAKSWLAPGREATHYFVAHDFAYSTGTAGPLAEWFLQFDNAIMWKFLDYSTLFVEGWVIIAVFFPGLFRVGLLLLGAFHIGVWLMLGIDFKVNAFVYVGFFMLPLARWFPEIPVLRSALYHRRSRSIQGEPARSA